MAMGRHHLKEGHGGQKFTQVMFNIAEAQYRNGRDGFEWDGEGWYGGDINRLTIKSEGEGAFGQSIADFAFTAASVSVVRGSGAPFFFAQNEFLISNSSGLLMFGGLALWALRQRRYSGWHRRLMLVAMSALTGPGLGRLLPMPLLIPYAWPIVVSASFVFPVIGMIADLRRDGRVHPAYWWGMGINVGSFLASMALAYSPLGYALTESVVAGTPGGERPMAQHLPPGFGM
jgi:hypothetical protein